MKYVAIATMLFITSLVIAQDPPGTNVMENAAKEGTVVAKAIPPQTAPASEEALKATPAPPTEPTPQTLTPSQSQEVKVIFVGGERVKCAGGRIVDERYAPRTRSHSHATRPESWYKDQEKYRNGESRWQKDQWSAISTAQATGNAAHGRLNDHDSRITALENAAKNIPWWGWVGLIGALIAVAALVIALLRRRGATFPGPAPYQNS